MKSREGGLASGELARHENRFQNLCSMLVSCGFFVELRYASGLDKILMFTGLISAVVAAVCVPLVVLFLGDMLSTFINYELSESYHAARNHAKKYSDVNELVVKGLRWLSSGTDINVKATFEDLVIATQSFAISVAVLGSIKWISASLCIYTLNHTAQRYALKIRVQYVKAILSNDLAWFDLQNKRDLCTSTTDLINDIHSGLGEKLGLLVFSSCIIIVCFIIALIRQWQLALISLAVIPMFIAILLIGRKVMKCLGNKESEAYKIAEASAEDSIKNIRHVTLYCGRNTEADIFHKCLNMSHRQAVHVGAFYGVFLGALWMCIYCGYACTFYFGVIITMDNSVIEPSKLITTFFCIQVGMLHIGNLPVMWRNVMRAKRSARKVFNTIDNISSIYTEKPVDVFNTFEQTGQPENEGTIIFQDVYFSYPKYPTVQVLNGVTFKINANETVAFVGADGCGITTVMRLIHRFYDPQKGQIIIDGSYLQHVNLQWLRRRVAYVMQDSALFGTTFADALKNNQPVTAKEISEVAQITGCHNYIASTTTQYASQVTADIPEPIMQRMVIARALLTRPHILILDKATTSLTANEERKLHVAINRHGTHKILMFATHRVESMAKADRVIHMGAGRVIESGTFTQLMKAKGELYHVYKRSIVTVPRRGLGWPDSLDEYEPVPSSSMTIARELSTHHRIQQRSYIDEDDDVLQWSGVYICRYPTPPRGVNDIPIDFAGFEEGDQHLYTWLTVLRLNSREWLYLTTACVAAAIAGFCLPAYAVLFGDCLAILANQPLDYEGFDADLANYTYLFLWAAFITGLAKIVQFYMIAVAGATMTKRLRKQVFNAILLQELAWFDENANKMETLLTLIRVDARNAKEATGPLVTSLAQAASTLIACVYLLLYYNVKIAFALIFLATPLLFSMLYYNAILTRHMFTEGVSLQKAKGVVSEAVLNIRSVMALGMQTVFLRQYAIEVVRVHSRMNTEIVRRSTLFGMCLAVPCYIYAICILFAGHLMQREQLDYAKVFKISEIVILGTIMIGQLISFSPKTVQARISASRILKVVNRTPLITSPITDFEEKWKCEGELKFRRVGFMHRTQMGLPVLKNFNLFVRSGTSVAVVGPLGSGKSVPIQLLVRFYNPTAGVIILDGRDTANIHLDMVRGQIGLADGNPIFFRRTIAENIAYGDVRRRMKMDEVMSSAKEANIHNYIATLSDGYQTIVDVDNLGMTYSQKLRLSLARALYRDPQILLIENLQQAESEEAEIMIEYAVKRALIGRTCLLVSNSIKSAISCTDYICVLVEGEMVEDGTHRELMMMRGVYYKLCCREELLHRRTESSLIFTNIVNDAAARVQPTPDDDVTNLRTERSEENEDHQQ